MNSYTVLQRSLLTANTINDEFANTVHKVGGARTEPQVMMSQVCHRLPRLAELTGFVGHRAHAYLC